MKKIFAITIMLTSCSDSLLFQSGNYIVTGIEQGSKCNECCTYKVRDIRLGTFYLYARVKAYNIGDTVRIR